MIKHLRSSASETDASAFSLNLSQGMTPAQEAAYDDIAQEFQATRANLKVPFIHLSNEEKAH
jgi:hypothetical protein